MASGNGCADEWHCRRQPLAFAGHLVDDGTFIYTYDPWNRLVKAAASEDSDVVVGQYGYDP